MHDSFPHVSGVTTDLPRVVGNRGLLHTVPSVSGRVIDAQRKVIDVERAADRRRNGPYATDVWEAERSDRRGALPDAVVKPGVFPGSDTMDRPHAQRGRPRSVRTRLNRCCCLLGQPVCTRCRCPPW
jgi:hypothetical protein